jgi:hypothetical protein
MQARASYGGINDFVKEFVMFLAGRGIVIRVFA